MKRIIIICEGQTEKEFCSKTLGSYFAQKACYIQSPLIKMSHGGIVKWNELKKQVETHYIQLHEFEGLLFNEVEIFRQQIPPDDLIGIAELEQVFAKFDNPEMINDNKDTSPSHRLERIIKGYKKVVYGNILAEAIGLQRIRQKSPRFNNWMNTLEQLLGER